MVRPPIRPDTRARELEQRIRELERLLGRKTMEIEILREALTAARVKSLSGSCCRCLITLFGECRGRHARGRTVQPRRAVRGRRQATELLSAPERLQR